MSVVITYLYPGTTVPTSRTPGNMVVATLEIGGLGNNSAAITHQFNLGADAISNGFPLVVLVSQNNIPKTWYEVSENPNYTVLQPSPGVGGSTKVFISRPNSLTR
jgi:hypothetical protein